MKTRKPQVDAEGRFRNKLKEGKIGWALLWMLGVPVPILIVLFLLRGCD